MFTIIGLMLTGMLLGFLLRKQKLSEYTKSSPFLFGCYSFYWV